MNSRLTRWITIGLACMSVVALASIGVAVWETPWARAARAASALASLVEDLALSRVPAVNGAIARLSASAARAEERLGLLGGSPSHDDLQAIARAESLSGVALLDASRAVRASAFWGERVADGDHAYEEASVPRDAVYWKKALHPAPGESREAGFWGSALDMAGLPVVLRRFRDGHHVFVQASTEFDSDLRRDQAWHDRIHQFAQERDVGAWVDVEEPSGWDLDDPANPATRMIGGSHAPDARAAAALTLPNGLAATARISVWESHAQRAERQTWIVRGVVAAFVALVLGAWRVRRRRAERARAREEVLQAF